MKRLVVVTDQGPHRLVPSTWYLVEEKERTRSVDRYGRSLDPVERYRPMVACITHLPENGISSRECERYAEVMARASDVDAAALNVLQLWDDQYSHSADEEERSVWDALRAAMERKVLP